MLAVRRLLLLLLGTGLYLGCDAQEDADEIPPEVATLAASLNRLETGSDQAWLSVWEAKDGSTYFAGGNRNDTGGRIARLVDGTITLEDIPPGPLLWWIHGLDNGEIWAAGEEGRILRKRDGVWEGTASGLSEKAVLWGIWGTESGAMWAVGGSVRRGGPLGVILRSDDHETWRVVNDPEIPDDMNLYKVWGPSDDILYVVGEAGTILHYDRGVFSRHDVPMRDLLFTVHGQPGGPTIAVGGMSEGQIFEKKAGAWSKVVDGVPFGLNGISSSEGGRALAVGARGTMLFRQADGAWYPVSEDKRSASNRTGIHGALMGRDVWAVGGDLDQMTDGFILTSQQPLPRVGF